jgi:hypothetical protein
MQEIKRHLMLAGVALSVVQATPSLAQTPASRTTVYDTAFFSSFAPRSALDIVRQVPGFSLDLGNVDVRGFAGAAGNVVINGARPSTKAESLETTLSRIPASRVLRVELGPGDLYGSDYSGRGQVVNVILSADAGLDGTLTGKVTRLFTGRLVPNLNASILVARGDHGFNLSGGTEFFDGEEEGFDRVTLRPEGEFFEHRDKQNSIRDRNPFLALGWGVERGATDAMHLNARVQVGRFDLHQDNHVTTREGEERDDQLDQNFDYRRLELGGDITRPLAGGALKLVGLANRRKRDNGEVYQFRSDSEDLLRGFRQQNRSTTGETLARLSWSRPKLLGFSMEVGAETALNTLKSDVQFFEFGPDGEEVRRNSFGGKATVRELRGEFYVNAGRNLSPALRLDFGLNYELSRLKVRGDGEADRSLRFLKPSATLDWKPKGSWHGQVSLRRTVAQLDFYDFISAAELSTDRVNGGNANLQPQRSWELRGLLERTLLETGQVKLEVGADRVSLLQDRILTEDGLDAPGNIGTGTRRFAAVTVDAPLDSFGIKGARVKAFGRIQRTRVEDPISGEQRNWSGFWPNWEWNIEARRDAGKFAYGFVLTDRAPFTFFRTDELDRNKNGGPYATAFAEYRPSARTTLTLDVDNLLNTTSQRYRTFFDPNRRDGPAVADEQRVRNKHLVFSLTAKQSFGGGGAKASAAAS